LITHFPQKRGCPNKQTGEIVPKIKIFPIIQSITIALIFFALGRLFVLKIGTAGIWISVGLLIIFYLVWWRRYQRDKKKGEE
jgi:Flp pilus assembly protein TadB